MYWAPLEYNDTKNDKCFCPCPDANLATDALLGLQSTKFIIWTICSMLLLRRITSIELYAHTHSCYVHLQTLQYPPSTKKAQLAILEAKPEQLQQTRHTSAAISLPSDVTVRQAMPFSLSLTALWSERPISPALIANLSVWCDVCHAFVRERPDLLHSDDHELNYFEWKRVF